MQVTITEKSKLAFEAAAQKLGLSTDLPVVTSLREDLALWIIANYMLAVIIEAGKDGKIYDITNHSKKKYFPFHVADDGYACGSSGGGFSYHVYVYDRGSTAVGARLSSNSHEECRSNAEEYPDLWEIVILNVK